MNLFFTRYTRCPWCGKRTTAGYKKIEMRLGLGEYRCESCKNIYWIDRAHSYSVITLLFAAVFLCAIFAAYIHWSFLLFSIPIIASIPFLAYRYCPRYKKIPSSDTSGINPSCYTERLLEESVAGQLESGVFVRKGEILTTVADFDDFPCFETASPVIIAKATTSGQIAFTFLYEHPDNAAVLRKYITLYRDGERIAVHTDTPFIGSGKILR